LRKGITLMTKRCEYRQKDRSRCEADAAGQWNRYGRIHDNPTWLCFGHAFTLGINRNPRLDINPAMKEAAK
jgi:hypothetical protein